MMATQYIRCSATIRDVGARNKGIAKRLLLLFPKGQQCGLPDDTGLNPARDGTVRSPRRFAASVLRQRGHRAQVL
jgi:hypothetical protein